MSEPTKIDTKDQAPKTHDEQQVHRRRLLFGSSALGAFGLLLTACGNTFGGFASGVVGKKRSDKPGGNTDLEDGGDDGIPAECRDLEGDEQKACIEQTGGGVDGTDGDAPPPLDGTNTDTCQANVTTKIDLSNIPVATGDLIPRVMIYGRTDSAMIALKWTSDKALGTLILTTPSGRLIALHGFGGADKNAAGAYRPVVVDNVWLKENGADISELKIVLQMAGGSVQHTAPVSFATTYGNLPVVDLANGGALAANVERWSVTRFERVVNTFNVDPDLEYPNTAGNGPRSLNTISGESQWTPIAPGAPGSYGQTGMSGIYTDIMGDTISLTGGAIREHNVFCTYVKDAGNTTYYRTILHIG